MVITLESGVRRWLWAISIGGLICGAPSMFFLFFRPLMVPFGFVMGSCLGGLWVILASYLLKKSLLEKWHFGAIGIAVGITGTIVWGAISGIYLKWFEGWAPFFIGTAFLIMTIAGFSGSVIGQIFMAKTGVQFRRSDMALAFVLSFNVLLFVFIPILNLR